MSCAPSSVFMGCLRLPRFIQFGSQGPLIVIGVSWAAHFLQSMQVRGVSGGEKRRCSIGVDLIHDPAVLFLDEPTSGLDSTSALNVVEVLHSLASERQRTVILSIHQPSFRIVDLLDSLLVLAHGRRIFHGRPRELYTFFDSIGQTVPEYVNPLEYVLDLIELQQDSPDGLNGLVASQGGRLLQVGRTTLADGRGEGSSTAGGGPSMDQKLREAPEYASSAWEEILTLCERDAINTRRTRSLTMSRVIVMIVIGTTAGSAFYNLPYTLDGARERTALLAFLVSLLCYNSMDALPVFLQHREVFVRETSRGAYRTWTYVVANFVVPLPLFLLLAVILSLCTYWLAHLVRTGQAFLFHALTCFLTLVTANSFVLFSTSVAPNFYAANGIVAGLYCLWFLFCGFFLVRTDIPAPWIWMHYFNIYKYPLENLLWIEFTPLKDTCFAYGPALSPAVSGNMTALSPSPLPPSCVEDGRGVLQALDLGKIKPLFNTGIMLLFTLSFRLAFFYFLRITTTSTRK